MYAPKINRFSIQILYTTNRGRSITEIEIHLDAYDFEKAMTALNKIGLDLDLGVKGE